MSNWTEHESLQYLRDKVKGVRTGMLTTYNSQRGFHSRPMGTADIDEEGAIWFFTNEYSTKAEEISVDNKVSITYSDPNDHTYISISGEAEFVDDKAKIKELFNPFIKAFFPEGLDDPKMILLKITLSDVEYWDSSSSKMVVLFNMLKAVVTGNRYDEGKHGTIDL
jgi:general stress protein 26